MDKYKTAIVNLETIIQYAILYVLIVLFFIVPKGTSPFIIWPCLIIFYGYFYLSVKQPFTLIKNISTFVKIDNFFLLFFYIIYYFPYQLYVLGFQIDTSIFLNHTYIEYTNISIIASTIGLVAFMMGFRKTKNSIPVMQRSDPKPQFYWQWFPYLVTGLLLFVCFLYMRTDWEKFLIGKYTGSDTGVATTDGLYFLITHFVVITIAVSVYYKRNGRNISFPLKIGLFIALLWCILLLRTGDRNTFFIITLVAIGGVSTYLKRFSALMVVGMILFAFLLYNVVEISRMQNVRSINSIIKIATQTQRYNSITEGSLGNTTITSRVTFHLVPQYHDFFLGKFKIIGFAGIIPFSRKLLVDPDDIFTTSSKILTKGLLGKNSTWGVGSNIISDIYMDFGIFGVAALMFLLGYFGNFVSWKAKTKTDSLKWSVIYLLTLALYCEIPRYSMDFPVRNIVWAFFLFWGFNFIIKLKQRNPILG